MHQLCVLYNRQFILYFYYSLRKKMKVLVTQSCPVLCDPMDCSPPGSSVHGILQAGILDWLPFPSPGNLPNPGFETGSPALQANYFTD